MRGSQPHLIEARNSDRRAGRPPFAPTNEQRRLVRMLAAHGVPQAVICRAIHEATERPISEPTLRKHFRHELTAGAVEATCAVAKALFDAAMGGSVTAMIFWLKCRAGWCGAPRRIEAAVDSTPLLPPALVAQFAKLPAPAQD